MRDKLRLRLAAELGDEQLATQTVDALSDDFVAQLDQLANGDIGTSRLLSYTAPSVSVETLGSIWVFAFGNRTAPDAGRSSVDLSGEAPGMDALLPGPVNQALAQATADVVERYPVPIFAQWEVAEVLDDLGVERVISIEPDIASDGTTTYLNTEGVARKGMQLADAAGVAIGNAGVLGFADHLVRCVMTVRAVGLRAGVPSGAVAPTQYDPESAQPWTRSRRAFVPADLLGRAWLASVHPTVVEGW